MITHLKHTLLALALTNGIALSTLTAQDGITGDWDMRLEGEGEARWVTLTFSKSGDGSYTGEWGSDKLSEVKFEENQLTFVQTRRRRDREFTQKYAGTLKDGKLEGVLSNERGETKMSGARFREKLAVLGHWDVDFKIEEQDMEARVSVTEGKDGALHGKWIESEREHEVTRVRFVDSNLTLDFTAKLEDVEFDVTMLGKVDGDNLTGSLISKFGEIDASGTRFGADLIGVWRLTSTTDRGSRTRLLRVFPDLTGRYETYGRELPVDLQFKDGQLVFDTEVKFGDRLFEMGLKGKLENSNKLTGEITTSRGSMEFTGNKRSSGSAVIGTWVFTRQTDNGERTSRLKIKDATSGTYTFRDEDVALDTLSVSGDEVAFKVTLKFNSREIPLEFKGNVDATELKGQWTTPRGTREAVGKRQTD